MQHWSGHHMECKNALESLFPHSPLAWAFRKRTGQPLSHHPEYNQGTRGSALAFQRATLQEKFVTLFRRRLSSFALWHLRIRLVQTSEVLQACLLPCPSE